jgi:tripartite ATP-independent transporter DctM subunit
MEFVFLAVLILMMMIALSSGYPVAFSLPGAAILCIGTAALCGLLFAGDSSAYFIEGGPFQWLSAGVTNFRSLYWDVERDTLIAVPLFIFMGIMLQRSKIAEDLLITMAQLFGPVPGGLGISVVLVGALLAATTGIVGATVIAMGLISLPAMLRNNYNKSLATGTICASGTLGQIIPPSIVLIILADQLTGATDQASTMRKAAYKAATGEFSMPSVLDVTSTSAGEMFMGALVPGLVLVALYVIYILFVALFRRGSAPPVPYEGNLDLTFLKRVALALAPPLTLILLVLGSIILGVATVNQAGAVGAVGAMIMGGYRLAEGRRNAYYPAILALLSTIALTIILSRYELNVKSIKPGDSVGLALAAIAAACLLVAIVWSIWRIYKIDNTLTWVMVETAKTSSMVFIILLGAAMLTAAFRGFGGEELVRHFLAGLEGGFWVQFLVVMLVMFILGFFIDFLEIAVVVVPIVAPILLADPGANVTAVWFGVMVGLNLQTSFLTPPFGFSLFYLRGVAPAVVKTIEI